MLLKNKKPNQPPYHLSFLPSTYSSLSPCHSWIFSLMNTCPTVPNLVPSAPISLSLVVLHPAVCVPPCLLLSFVLHHLSSFPLCFHTPSSSIHLLFSSSLVKQVYSLFCHLKVLLLYLPSLLVLDKGGLRCFCCFSYTPDVTLQMTEKIWPSPSRLSPKQPLLWATTPARSCSTFVVRSQLVCRQTASFQLSKCEVPMITDHLGCLSSQNQVTRSQIL